MPIWAEIEGVKGCHGPYEVSSEGEVRQVKRCGLKEPVMVNGHKVFRFLVNGKVVQRSLLGLMRSYHDK